jgi:hypothetical protein
MNITLDDEAIDELTQKILIRQYEDLTASYAVEPEGEDKDVYEKVLAALRVVLSWNCTPQQCVDLKIEWKI